MEFRTYWLSMAVPDRAAFAKRCRMSPNYLNLVAFGQKDRVGADKAIVIERESDGLVTCEEMRPDVDWAFLRNGKKRQVAEPRRSASRR
jgi:DNA-binding transcriptional regulator YdaS (Cro superfamily)